MTAPQKHATERKLTWHGPDASNNARLIMILSGDNPRKIEFIKLKPPVLNSNGEVQDEWGMPLQISIGVHTKIRVTSAGPDKIFGTPDDIANQ